MYYEVKRFCSYGDNYDADRFITQFSHWNPPRIQNLKEAFIYTMAYLYYLEMSDSEEIIQFCIQLILADAINYNTCMYVCT